MSITNLNTALGGLVAGTWANSMLFTVEILQVYEYYKSYPNDSRYFQAVVALLFFNDIINTVAANTTAYLYCVTHWGDLAYLGKAKWPIFVHIITMGLSAAITQTFLTYRFLHLSRNSVIAISLFILILTAFAGAVTTALFGTIFAEVSLRWHIITACTIWLVTSAIADVCIAAALICRFRYLTSYTSLPNVRSVIQRLLIATIKTGSATSIIALTIFTLYIIDPKSNRSLGLGFILGRLYSLTMLANLNARNRLQGEIGSQDVDFEPKDWLKTSATRRGQQLDASAASVIHIVKTVHVEETLAQKYRQAPASLSSTECGECVNTLAPARERTQTTV